MNINNEATNNDSNDNIEELAQLASEWIETGRTMKAKSLYRLVELLVERDKEHSETLDQMETQLSGYAGELFSRNSKIGRLKAERGRLKDHVSDLKQHVENITAIARKSNKEKNEIQEELESATKAADKLAVAAVAMAIGWLGTAIYVIYAL